jgi:SAM-dependent methyltransferase
MNSSEQKSGARDYSQLLINTLRGQALAVALAIGHETRLFDAMADINCFATSEQIAKQANLNERYVREWLGCVVCGGLVQYDPANSTYLLPPEAAVLVSRKGGLSNMALTAYQMSTMTDVREKIAACFRTGRGLGYEHYALFHPVMAEASVARLRDTLLSDFVPSVTGLVGRLRNGIKVLDVGCGHGLPTRMLARAFPTSEFFGFDFSEQAIARATEEASREGLPNAHFERFDVSKLLAERRLANFFDYVTAFDAIHDQAFPDKVLAGIYHVLKPGGHFSMVDIKASSKLEENVAEPMAPFFFAASFMHCMAVSLAEDGGMGLGTMWGHQKATEMLQQAGLKLLELKPSSDRVNYHYYCQAVKNQP